MRCPKHRRIMTLGSGAYGRQWTCPVEGCDIMCYSGPTSTPADAVTRALRAECHAAFDPLWKGRTHFYTRGMAYRWLREVMHLSESAAHIGKFNKEQCYKLLNALNQIYLKKQEFYLRSIK